MKLIIKLQKHENTYTEYVYDNVKKEDVEKTMEIAKRQLKDFLKYNKNYK